MNGVNITISATPTTNRVPGDSLTLSDLAAFVERPHRVLARHRALLGGELRLALVVV